MKFNVSPVRILENNLVLPTIFIVIVHYVTMSTSTSSVESLVLEDFHHLTDKLTHKIMENIEKLKATDPNWGQPPKDMGEDDMTQEQMKRISECEFHCPKGQMEVENEEFKMPVNKNCKDYDSMWDRIPGASGCCKRHQICYHTCGLERTRCDMEFTRCMENVCEELQEKGIIKTEKVIEACVSAMRMLGIMVMEPGCNMYPKAQGAACRCVDKDPGDDVDADSSQSDSNTSGKFVDNERRLKDLTPKEDDIVINDKDNENIGDVEMTIANDDDDDDFDNGIGVRVDRDEL
ncbi:uncharacterized protein LOC129281685 [Lytechinus pictus]|uniref:uncharacterized protein LOC129281685 n=1 Tax=Lytechinus pictus TaxID=7653 RepID=UPI0030BA206C